MSYVEGYGVKVGDGWYGDKVEVGVGCDGCGGGVGVYLVVVYVVVVYVCDVGVGLVVFGLVDEVLFFCFWDVVDD